MSGRNLGSVNISAVYRLRGTKGKKCFGVGEFLRSVIFFVAFYNFKL